MRVLFCLALTSAFAPLAPVAVRRDTTQSMKKPSPALEQGPLPGLSETNYKVLAGIAALGFGAPALLFVANVVVPGMAKPEPPAKKKPAAGQAAPAAAKADAKFALPTLPKSKSKTAPSDKAKDQSAKKLDADRAKAEASAAATAKKEAQAAAKAAQAAAKAGKPALAPVVKAAAPAPKPAPAPAPAPAAAPVAAAPAAPAAAPAAPVAAPAAPAAPVKAVLKDTQVGVPPGAKSFQGKLVDTPANAKSGDDVGAALKARRSK